MNGVKTTFSLAQRNKNRGNPTWYGRINDGRSVHYVSLKTSSKSKAHAWLETQWLRKNTGLSDTPTDAPVELSVAARKWLVSVEASKGAGSLTFLAYESRIRKFVDFLQNRKANDFQTITPSLVGDFVGGLSTQFSGKTAGEVIKVAHAFWSFWDTLLDNPGKDPFRGIKRPKIIRKVTCFWTTEQCDAIISAAPDEHYAFLWSLMAYAGLRYNEAYHLTWEAIRDGRITLVGKMNSLASIPVSTRIQKFLGFGKTGKIFEGKISPYNDTNLAVLRRTIALMESKFEGVVTHHRFRHSFASNLIRSGVNIKVVQQLMRHESIQITLNTYSHLLDYDLSDAIEALDGAFRGKKAYTIDDLNLIQTLYDGCNAAELCGVIGASARDFQKLIGLLFPHQNMPSPALSCVTPEDAA